MNRTKRWPWLLLAMGCAMTGIWGCFAVSRQPSPIAQYRTAIDAKYAGDAETYYNTMLQLAHDAHHTRAGRRARASLMRSQAWTAVWMQTASTLLHSTSSLGDYMDNTGDEDLSEGDE